VSALFTNLLVAVGMGAGASTSNTAGASSGPETATVALDDARKALAEAKAELVHAVEQQHERQLEQQQEVLSQQHAQSSAQVPDSAAVQQFVSARSSWQNVGTIELVAPSVEDRKTSMGATLGAAMTDTRRLVRATVLAFCRVL
jgi:hypothetical protein